MFFNYLELRARGSYRGELSMTLKLSEMEKRSQEIKTVSSDREKRGSVSRCSLSSNQLHILHFFATEGESISDEMTKLIAWAKRARAYLEKELPHAKSSLERFESTLGHNKVAQETVIPRLKKDIAELEQLLGECGE